MVVGRTSVFLHVALGELGDRPADRGRHAHPAQRGSGGLEAPLAGLADLRVGRAAAGRAQPRVPRVRRSVPNRLGGGQRVVGGPAVVTALADDDRAADAAMAAAEPVWEGSPDAEDPWLRAARCGPADPVIARASRRCFETAEAALTRSGAPTEIRQAVSEFTERYVQKDRCPADDQLEGAR